MIAPTSLEAYDKIKATLPVKRRAVLSALEKMSEACNKTLAWRMKWPINCITPRTGELRKQGLIVDTNIYEISGHNHQYFKAAKPKRLF
jgi:hypothetical protein